ncbi:N-acetylneuraminate synthase family protein [Candidatus Omnitrophota bacterium]
MDNKFDNLFILDLANNHQGDIEHAKTIIKEISEVVKKYKVRAGIKFQFRDLENFIHKYKREIGKDKMVDRFLTTNLNDKEFFELKKYVDSLGLLTACTPFDEASVEKVVKMRFDYIKIASCLAQDWPLVKKIRDTDIPLVVSTGGLSLEEIDELVYFISKRRKEFALMHCVSVYPTADELFNLRRIGILSRRYPSLKIGWSTHEDPSDYQTINLSYSLGARVFEKHIGKNTEKYSLNQYSATGENIDQWLNSFVEMKKKIDTEEEIFLESQKAAIKKLVRGSFVKRYIGKNKKIEKDDLYYAFPCDENAIRCPRNFESVKTREDIKIDAALTPDNAIYEISREGLIEKAILKLRMFLQKNNFIINHYNHVVLSCHSGLDKFYSVGSYFIDCSSRHYIKKIIVMLPGQVHPSHRHTDRSELYSMIRGDLVVTIDGEALHLREGEQVVVDRNRYHEFSSKDGAVFEEISYTKNRAESQYRDNKINKTDRSKRIIRIEEKIL